MEQEAETVEAPVTETPVSETIDDRPEWLPEKFNTPEDLSKAYSALSSKLGEKEEDVRNRVMEELQQQASEGVPEDAGSYELPDFVDPEEAADNSMLQEWAEHCHKNGYTHEEFQKGLEMYMNGMGPEPNLEAQAKLLGDNAEARIEAASLFANKFFPEDALPAIERMCEGADGIIALEAIMSQMQDPSVSEQANIASNLSEVELTEMMKDPKYSSHNQRDQNYVKMIDEGWKRLYAGRN
tara:strand:+ start:13812 stop:14531 length:720 start_codon:yes stop_codon:yes gene_type:complete